MFYLILSQSVRLAFRKGGGAFGACAFYIIVMTMFTFALGAQAMAQYGAAAMCISLLLATITSLPLLFERDYEDGSMEQLLLQPYMLELIVLAKICGQFISHIFPIIAVSPILAIMSGMSSEQIYNAIFVLFLAAPSMVALGAISAALTLGSKRGGLLQALIIMPLYIPILIFAATNGEGSTMFLSAIICVSIPLSCSACGALIRFSVE